MRPWLDQADRSIAYWMYRHGHFLHRVTLGGFFAWVGLLKVFGVPTATTLLAQVVYLSRPEVVVPLLGAWELAIGVCLVVRPLLRLALFLLAVRLPGTFLALVLLPEICFVEVPWVPSLEGQYLLKDLMLFSAAVVIGGTVREAQRPCVRR